MNNKSSIALFVATMCLVCIVVLGTAFSVQAGAGGTHDCEPWPDCNQSSSSSSSSSESSSSSCQGSNPDGGECNKPDNDNGSGNDETCEDDNNGQGIPAHCRSSSSSSSSSSDSSSSSSSSESSSSSSESSSSSSESSSSSSESSSSSSEESSSSSSESSSSSSESSSSSTESSSSSSSSSNEPPAVSEKKNQKPPKTGCTVDDLVVVVRNGDLFRLIGQPYGWTNEANLSAGLDLAVANPDGKGCQVVAEAEDGNLYIFGLDGSARLVVDTPDADENNPTFNASGNVYFDDGAAIYEMTIYGNLLGKVADGTYPVVLDSQLAYKGANGNLVVNGAETAVSGTPVNFDWNSPLLYFLPEGMNEVWFYNLNSGETGKVGGVDLAPDPGAQATDGLTSVNGSSDYWRLTSAESFGEGAMQDWWHR